MRSQILGEVLYHAKKEKKNKDKLSNRGKLIPFCVLVLESLHVPSLQKTLYHFGTLMERHNKYRHSSSLLSMSISESVGFSFSCQNQHTLTGYGKNFLYKTRNTFSKPFFPPFILFLFTRLVSHCCCTLILSIMMALVHY